MSLFWLAASVWAYKTGRDPVGYGTIALFLAIIDTIGFWSYLSS